MSNAMCDCADIPLNYPNLEKCVAYIRTPQRSGAAGEPLGRCSDATHALPILLLLLTAPRAAVFSGRRSEGGLSSPARKKLHIMRRKTIHELARERGANAHRYKPPRAS